MGVCSTSMHVDPPRGRPTMLMQTPWMLTPRCRPPWKQTPPGGRSPGLVTCNACWEANPLANRQTGVKTLPYPKLSFAGSNNKKSVVNILGFCVGMDIFGRCSDGSGTGPGIPRLDIGINLFSFRFSKSLSTA